MSQTISHGKTESFLLAVANNIDNIDYVAVDNNVIYGKEELWERLKQSLLKALAQRRMEPRKRGRPAKGPGSGLRLGNNSSEIARVVCDAYDYLARGGKRVAFAEVARRVGMSESTLWRWRRLNAWPPTMDGRA